jgi:hypothetical protein
MQGTEELVAAASTQFTPKILSVVSVWGRITSRTVRLLMTWPASQVPGPHTCLWAASTLAVLKICVRLRARFASLVESLRSFCLQGGQAHYRMNRFSSQGLEADTLRHFVRCLGWCVCLFIIFLVPSWWCLNPYKHQSHWKKRNRLAFAVVI